MKKLFIAAAIIFGMSNLNAQTFSEGTSVVQIGAGIGSDFGLPLGLSYEYGISDKIGVGAYVGYASKSYNTPGFAAFDYKVTYMIFGAKGNYHFYQSDKIDAYGGVLLGYNSAKLTYDNGQSAFAGTPTYGGAVFGGTVGARYYFTNNIAAFAELGYGIGYLTAGLAYKL